MASGSPRLLDRSTSTTAPQDDAPRARRWWVWLGVVIVGALLLRLAAPLVLAPWIASRLASALSAEVEVADVDLGLLAGELTVRGLDAVPASGASESRLRIDAITVRIRWIEILRGLPYAHASASGVDLIIDTSRPWPKPETVERARAQSLRSLELEGGRVRLILAPGAPAVDVLTDMHASVVDTSTGRRTTGLSTRISLAAVAGNGGSISIDGLIAPVEPAASWTFSFVLDRLDLRPFNPLFQSFFAMDLEHGWLSLHGELSVGLGRVRGRILPRFDELQILGRGEKRVRHPMAEALFGSMLASADIPIIVDELVPEGGGIAAADAPRLEPIQLLNKIILRGFIRRLDTITGYEANAARLALDLPAGRMSFYDVTLTKDGGGVETPFVSVARLDIVVEQSAVDSEVLTYKAVTLFQPSLVFVTGDSAATSQLQFDPLWQDKVSVLPYPTDRVDVIDGRVEYRDDTTDPPTSLYAANIELHVDNLGRARVGTTRRAAPLTASARVMDMSDLRVEADLSPGAVPIDASVRLHMGPLPLRELNDLLRARLQVDVTGGTLAIEADLDAHEGRMRGTVTAALPGVAVIGSKEVEFQRPIREFMLERRLRKLDGKPLNVEYLVHESLLRELPGALLSAALRSE